MSDRSRGGFGRLLTVLATAGLASGALLSLQSDTDSAVARFNRALGLLDQLKFEAAAAEFDRLAAAYPDFVAARVNQGIALYYGRRTDAARRALLQAVSLDRQQPNARYVLGLIAADAGAGAEAQGHFEFVRSRDPDDASTRYYLGRLKMEQRRYDEAIAEFEEVVVLEPYNASARYNLATALARSGERDRALAEMREFQRLQGLYGSRTMGLTYLEQGPYAAPVDTLPPSLLGDDNDADSFDVRFVDVAVQAGIDFHHGGKTPPTLQVTDRRVLERSLVPWVGSGVAFGDYDNDGDDDLFFADAGGGAPAGRLYRNRGDGRFEDVTLAVGLTGAGPTMQPLWGDLDRDGNLDLYLVNYGPNRYFRGSGGGRFEETAAALGIDDASWGLGGVLVDFDHDGDLDIYVANFTDPATLQAGRFPDDLRGAANVLYRNNGNGTFTDVSALSGLADAGRSTAVVAADFDASRDIDLFVVNQDGPDRLYHNRRDGSFAATPGSQPAGPSGSLGVAVGPFNRDRMDLFVAAPESALLLNRGPAAFRAGRAPGIEAHGAQFLDVDNDGDLDLLTLDGLRLVGDPGPGDGLRLFQNRGGRLVEVTRQAGLQRFRGLAVRGVSAADIDRDGDLDVAVSVSGGAPLLLRNDGGNRRHWLFVDLKSVNSSPSGIGTRVEVLAGRQRLLRQVGAGSGFLSSLPPTAHFGLGQHARVDAVRLLWPNGVLQTEIDDPAVDRRRSITELNRKGTSCPLLYVWDGERYRFQTDFLGGSAFGYRLAPAAFNFPDTDEYVKLNRDQVALRDGAVSITLNNQLEEVIFFDRLQLVAVDHPRSYNVYPDEKLLPGPPYGAFGVVTAAAARPPRSAVDGRGHDQLPALRQADRRYADIVRPLPFKGYAESSELILDLGNVDPESVWLLMHAWIDYADSTSNVAASQAGLTLAPPQLEVQDAEGRWVTAIERMGFPAGLPKTMTVDLSGRFRSASRRVRIRTDMRIHWDRILVASGPQRTDYRLHRIETDSALLSAPGFPGIVKPDGREPRLYDHGRMSATAPWKVHVGAYTRLGEVGPLLSATDDRYVVTRSGDQIEARFDVTSLPDLPADWVRDYFVFVDGFGKDMDPNSAAPHAVGPLPFHAMSAFPYPPGESYPASGAHRRYQQQWNTRLVESPLPPLVPGIRFHQKNAPPNDE